MLTQAPPKKSKGDYSPVTREFYQQRLCEGPSYQASTGKVAVISRLDGLLVDSLGKLLRGLLSLAVPVD